MKAKEIPDVQSGTSEEDGQKSLVSEEKFLYFFFWHKPN